MRIARACAGFAVGGMVTFGSISAAAAGDLLDAGENYFGTSQVNVLELDEPIPELVRVTVTDSDPVLKVQVGGTTQTNGLDGGLDAVLAKPLPLKLTVLAAPKYCDCPR